MDIPTVIDSSVTLRDSAMNSFFVVSTSASLTTMWTLRPPSGGAFHLRRNLLTQLVCSATPAPGYADSSRSRCERRELRLPPATRLFSQAEICPPRFFYYHFLDTITLAAFRDLPYSNPRGPGYNSAVL